MSKQYNLTPVELKFMDILWKLGQGTVRDVMANLPEGDNPAYTSVSTILRILEQKKILTPQKVGRQHIYKPTISKEVYATHSVKKMVNQVFGGKPVDLVAYLVDKNGVTAEEIAEMQKLLDARKQEVE